MVKNVTVFISALVVSIAFISNAEAGKKEVEALKDWKIKDIQTPSKSRKFYYSDGKMKLKANTKRSGMKAKANLIQQINQTLPIFDQNGQNN